MKPKYAPEPRRTNEKPPALLGVVVRIGTVPAVQRIADHQVTVRSALSLSQWCGPPDNQCPRPALSAWALSPAAPKFLATNLPHPYPYQDKFAGENLMQDVGARYECRIPNKLSG